MTDTRADADRAVIPGESLTRRQFVGRSALALGGAALGSSLLSACAGGHRSAAGESATDRTLRVSNWPLYIDEDIPAEFTTATGIPVRYTEDISDNNAFFAKIAEPLKRGQSIGRDVAVLTDWMLARMIRLGYCAPLDYRRFPNSRNLVGDLRNVSSDPGRQYTMPWLSGMTGLAYNRKKTGRDLTSVHDLFDPTFKGRVTMLVEMRDTLGLMMMSQGRDPAHATDADMEAACVLVERYRNNGQIRLFTNDYAEDLASGNITVAMGWSGDIAGLAGDNPDLRFVVPDEGGLLFSDCMFIPSTSSHVDEAMTWMNYVYEPGVSARIVASTLYISPVQGTAAELARSAPALVNNPLVNPNAALRARLHDFRALSDDEERRYTERYYRAMGI